MTELTVVVPTLNERQNVAPLVERLTAGLKGVEWEVIFVDDDSTDGTAEECRHLAALNPRVRLIQRIGRRGLASACLEGMLASTAPYVAVMDGDMQHDETVLTRMLEAAKINDADVVVGSRHAAGGGIGSLANERVWLSNLGRHLSKAICSYDLSDPMSGFFLLNRNYLDKTVRRVSGIGFKILLDLITSSAGAVRIIEMPYVFRTRLHGKSKLDLAVGFEFFVLLANKILRRNISPSFALFSTVSTAAGALHLLVLTALYQPGFVSFLHAQLVAATLTMASSFFLYNLITRRTTRLRDWVSIATGLLGFCAVCSLGVISNLVIAKLLVNHHVHWILAGIAGILFGSVWNYSATAILTWHIGQARARRRIPTAAEALAPFETARMPA